METPEIHAICRKSDLIHKVLDSCVSYAAGVNNDGSDPFCNITREEIRIKVEDDSEALPIHHLFVSTYLDVHPIELNLYLTGYDRDTRVATYSVED